MQDGVMSLKASLSTKLPPLAPLTPPTGGGGAIPPRVPPTGGGGAMAGIFGKASNLALHTDVSLNGGSGGDGDDASDGGGDGGSDHSPGSRVIGFTSSHSRDMSEPVGRMASRSAIMNSSSAEATSVGTAAGSSEHMALLRGDTSAARLSHSDFLLRSHSDALPGSHSDALPADDQESLSFEVAEQVESEGGEVDGEEKGLPSLSDLEDNCLSGEDFRNAGIVTMENSTEDLNRVSDEELARRKAEMDLGYEANRLKPGDEGYVYNKEVEFGDMKMESGWDSDADSCGEF